MATYKKNAHLKRNRYYFLLASLNARASMLFLVNW